MLLLHLFLFSHAFPSEKYEKDHPDMENTILLKTSIEGHETFHCSMEEKKEKEKEEKKPIKNFKE
jgi:hypothetical protein